MSSKAPEDRFPDPKVQGNNPIVHWRKPPMCSQRTEADTSIPTPTQLSLTRDSDILEQSPTPHKDTQTYALYTVFLSQWVSACHWECGCLLFCVCVCVLVGLVIELQWEPWQSVYTGVSENWAGALKYTSCGCKHIQGFLRTDIFSQESLLIERLVSPSPQRTKWIWPNNIIHW